MAASAGRITLSYSPPSVSEGVGHIAGHVFVSVTDNRTGETRDLDVWSTGGGPVGSPLYMNAPTEERREEHSQQGWDLNARELRDVMTEIIRYYETPMDYAVVGQSCVTASTDVLRAAGIEVGPIAEILPAAVWAAVEEQAEDRPGYHRGLCEEHRMNPQMSDPDWEPEFDVHEVEPVGGRSDPGDDPWGPDDDGGDDDEYDDDDDDTP